VASGREGGGGAVVYLSSGPVGGRGIRQGGRGWGKERQATSYCCYIRHQPKSSGSCIRRYVIDNWFVFLVHGF
jgi:hypothetical protein